MAEIDKVQRNLNRMIEQGANDKEINEYLTLENVTEAEIRAFGRRQNIAGRQLSVDEQLAQLRKKGFDPKSGMSIDMFRFVSEQPRVIDRLFGRGAFEGTGATAVGIPSAVKGGTRAGAIGGVVGAVAGTLAFDVVRATEDLIDFPSTRTLSAEGIQKSAARELGQVGSALGFEAGGQAAIAGIARGASPVLRGAGAMLGLRGEASKRAAGLLRSENIPFGPVDTGTSATSAFFKPLSVMPLISKPARVAMNRKLVRISQRFTGLLDEVAESIPLPRLGADIGDAARSRFNSARSGVARLYVDMYDAFARIGNPRVIPTSPLKRRAKELLGTLDELPREVKTVARETGVVDEFGKSITRETTEPGKRVGEFASGDQAFREQLERFIELDEFVTPVELRALQKSMNRAIRLRKGATGAEVEFGMLIQMQRAATNALESIDPAKLPPEQATQIIGKIKNANTSYAQLMESVSTPAAKRLSRADPGLFRPGDFSRGGNIDIDQLADDIVGAQSTLRSPDFITSLDGLIGVENRQKLGRVVLEKAAKASVVEDISLGIVRTKGKRGRFGRRGVVKTEELRDVVVFNPEAMETALGIGRVSQILGGGATKTNKDAIAALLKGTGVSVDTITRFLKAAKQAQSVAAGNASVFLTRRLMLTGKFTLPGASITTTPTDAGFVAKTLGAAVDIGGLIVGGRLAVKMLTTERGMRLLTEGMKINTNRTELFRWLIRVRRAFPDDDVSIKDLPLEKQEEALEGLDTQAINRPQRPPQLTGGLGL